MSIKDRSVDTKFIIQAGESQGDIVLEAYPVEAGIVIVLGKMMSNGQYETLLDIVIDHLAANLERWSREVK
ncbi:MAG TPA: hypothetical protein VMV78_14545 [Thiobacillus sp.]|nr:hypothetical protein [Thiobacillus sp.]